VFKETEKNYIISDINDIHRLKLFDAQGQTINAAIFECSGTGNSVLALENSKENKIFLFQGIALTSEKNLNKLIRNFWTNKKSSIIEFEKPKELGL